MISEASITHDWDIKPNAFFYNNIQLYLSLAIGSNRLLHREIDTLFNQYKREYLDAYRASRFVEETIFDTYNIANQDAIKKVAGIVAWSYTHDDSNVLHSLIRHGFKFTWNYIKQQKLALFRTSDGVYVEPIFIDDYFDQLVPKLGGPSKANDLDTLWNTAILLYLADLNGISVNLNSDLGDVLHSDFELYSNPELASQSLYKKEATRYRKEIDEMYDFFRIPRKTKSMLLSTLLRTILQSETYAVEAQAESLGLDYDADYVMKNVTASPLLRYISTYTQLFLSLDINDKDIAQSCTVTAQDFESVFLGYILARKQGDLKEHDKVHFVISSLFIKALANDYREAKKMYFAQQAQMFRVTSDQTNKPTRVDDEEKRRLQAEIDSLKAQLRTRDKEIEQQHESYRVLNKETEQLKRRLGATDEHQKELFALREYVYQLENDTNVVPAVKDFDNMVHTLRQRKIAIVGGHMNWQQKIRDAFPDFRIFDANGKTADVSSLDSMDAVFINTATLAHAVLLRAVKQMNKNQTPLFYLHHAGNFELSVREMYDRLVANAK